MSETYDIIVIGGGIAGLTAGLTAARLGLRTRVLGGQVLGGQLLSIAEVDGFPGHPEGIPGFDLCPATEEAATAAGAEVIAEDAEALARDGDGWIVTGESATYRAKAVVLATGSALKTLDVPGETRLTGKGVSHCASCDAPLLKGKEVVVIGGGDSALQEALTLVPVVSRVTILTDGPGLTAQASYQERIRSAANVDVICGARVLEIIGEDGVTGVRYGANGAEQTVPAASAFIFVGLKPNAGLATGLGIVDDAGLVRVDHGMRTTAERLYAAGTVRSGAAFRAAASAGDGAAAAISADADLNADDNR
ncbi:MAG: NAD(P)/FAD-dependent oxidoreductase [Hyphomicrobiaceae bacterium]